MKKICKIVILIALGLLILDIPAMIMTSLITQSNVLPDFWLVIHSIIFGSLFIAVSILSVIKCDKIITAIKEIISETLED